MADMDEPGAVLVTGATSGIGFVTARLLAERGRRVIVHGRTASSAAAAAETLRVQGGDADSVAVDLADLDAVHALSRDLLSRPLDAVVFNAALVDPPEPATRAGLDTTLTVNSLAPHLMLRVLDPTLAARGGRAVLVSSLQHTKVERFDADVFEVGGSASAATRYQMTKLLALLMLTHRDELPRTQSEGRSAGIADTVAVDPGFVRTRLGRSSSTAFRLMLWLMKPIQTGPERPARLIERVVDDHSIPAGSYVAVDGPAKRSAAASDPAQAAEADRFLTSLLAPYLDGTR